MQRPEIADVRALLSSAGMRAPALAAVGEGRTAWTYLVDDEWIVQIPRYQHVAEAARTQAAVLPVVAEHVPFAVPAPEVIAHHHGHPVVRHRKLPGRALQPGDRWRDLAAVLRALHRVPVEAVAPLLGLDTAPPWRQRWAQFRDQLDASPHVPDDLRRPLVTALDQLPDPEELTFVHADLAAEHVLVDPGTRRPTGLIDFDWATVGDPALDFVGLLSALGPAATRELIAEHGQVSWQRLQVQWCLNPCHALVHAGAHLDPTTRQEQLTTARARLDALPR